MEQGKLGVEQFVIEEEEEEEHDNAEGEGVPMTPSIDLIHSAFADNMALEAADIVGGQGHARISPSKVTALFDEIGKGSPSANADELDVSNLSDEELFRQLQLAQVYFSFAHRLFALLPHAFAHHSLALRDAFRSFSLCRSRW